MKIVQISDCHLFADLHKCGYNQINPFDSLQQVLHDVKTQQPDRLIVTGDLSGDASKQSYQHFSALLQDCHIDCPISILLGNHDCQDSLSAHFSASQLWQTTSPILLNHDWCMHLLNSQSQGTKGFITAEDLAALALQLQTYPKAYHVIAVHHHPIACGGWMDKHEWVNRKAFTDLLARFSHVKAVVHGHIHMDIEQQQNGCVYLACPSTCWQWANTQEFVVSDLAPGYRVINLAENGQIRTSVFRLNG